MRIFFAGPLNDLKDPETTKAFYRRLADVAKANGFDYFWAFLNGTDPILNPDVPPQDVYRKDIKQLSQSDVMVAYVGDSSVGTGIEIEYANTHNIPVYILYEKGKRISRMLRGCPAVKKEIVFTSHEDALKRFDTLLSRLHP
ncbi:MAG: nucleoside 2-deoxyribosyltransferase [Candidatus Gottesmanbacteria bacterium]|nr:nucleoside 2-deoxyribosyltransferase [Candidatus Gottesmanbacteria bacterium]